MNDIVIAGKSDKKISEVKKSLDLRFEVKDMGELHYLNGMKIIQDHKSGKLLIGQPAYTESVLQKFDIMNAKEISTPVDPSTKLVKVTDAIDPRPYQTAVGSLLYLIVDWI